MSNFASAVTPLGKLNTLWGVILEDGLAFNLNPTKIRYLREPNNTQTATLQKSQKSKNLLTAQGPCLNKKKPA